MIDFSAQLFSAAQRQPNARVCCAVAPTKMGWIWEVAMARTGLLAEPALDTL